MNNYATLLSDKKRFCYNFDESIKYFKMSIEKGNDDSMVSYGLMLYNGNDRIKINKKESFKYFKMAADNGDKDMAMKYSLMARNGDMIKQDNKVADEYLKKAADLKLLEAQLIVAKKLMELKNPKCLIYFEAAADNGDVESMKIAGRLNNEKTEKFIKINFENDIKKENSFRISCGEYFKQLSVIDANFDIK